MILYGITPSSMAANKIPLVQKNLNKAQTETKTPSLVKESSHVVAITFRAGLFGFLGHEHAVLAQDLKTNLQYDPKDLKNSSIEIIIPAKSLIVDTKEARQKGGLDSKGPGESDVIEIQNKMMGPDVLDSEKFKTIEFKSTQIKEGSSDSLVVKGDFLLHGKKNTVEFPVKVTHPSEHTVNYTGVFKFNQTEYGMKPVSVAGVINVKDEMEIRFQISLASGT